jgi:peroxiredoxin
MGGYVLRLSRGMSRGIGSVLFFIAMLPAFSHGQTLPGLEPGAHAPAFTLKDSAGKTQNLSSLSGPNGLLLLFFRSADWCPFCKGQLVDLESQHSAFEAKGIHVAAVSYDSAAILADFAHRRAITYPLLADPSSSLIDAFGIRNPQGTGMQTGIPYPGYYLIRKDGTIEKRFFETAYVNRLTASNVYGNLFGDFALPAPSKEIPATPHVSISTLQSDSTVTPGAVVKLAVVIQPGPDVHIYATGAEKLHYNVASLAISPAENYSASASSYPKSELMEFPELGQTVPVYTGRTVFSTSVAAVVNQKTIPAFAKSPSLVVKGVVNYQACTSKVCFPPTTIPVEWKVGLKQLDLERAPGSIQHK